MKQINESETDYKHRLFSNDTSSDRQTTQKKEVNSDESSHEKMCSPDKVVTRDSDVIKRVTWLGQVNRRGPEITEFEDWWVLPWLHVMFAAVRSFVSVLHVTRHALDITR